MTTASPYNNPLFAQGLSGLVSQFIGDPQAEAAQQLNTSQALLNNQTAQYRDAIGDTGMSGDLAGMMVRALQAGPQYAAQAPTIGQNAIKFGAIGYGDGAYSEPQADNAMGQLADLTATMTRAASVPRTGGSGGSGGSGGPTPNRGEPKQSELDRLARTMRDYTIDDYELTHQDRVELTQKIIEDWRNGDGTMEEATTRVLQNISVNDNVTDDNFFFGEEANNDDDGGDGFFTNLWDGFRGPSTSGPPTLNIGQPSQQPNVGQPNVGQPNVGQPNLPRVANDADYEALPPGTRFLDPNNEIRVKP